MKKLFILSFMLCLLGGNRAWAGPYYYFSESSKVLSVGATSFNFRSVDLMSSGFNSNGSSQQTIFSGWIVFDQDGKITYKNDQETGGTVYGDPYNIIDITNNRFENVSEGWTLRVNFDFAQDDWNGWFFKHQTTEEYGPIQNAIQRVDGWHEVTLNGNTFWSMYGYYEAVLTAEAVTYLKQNGINLRGKSITIQSVDIIPPATTYDANSFDWTAETYGEVELTSGYSNKTGNIYTLSTSTPNLGLNGQGGSIVIIATGKQNTAAAGHRAYYVVTVPYPDNHVWDFFTDPGITPRTDANWTDDYKSKAQDGTNSHKIIVATPNESATDGYNYINQTNAFYIPETAGLLFDVKSARLGYNNEGGKKLVTWGGYHITSNGSNNDGSHPKFIIPQVKGEKYIRIWWDAMAQGSGGGNFKVTNLLDLEGKLVSNQFAITGVTVSGQCKGCIIFKVNGSASNRQDITIEMQDQGWNDLYKIEICDDYDTDMVLFQSQNSTTGWNTGGAVEYNNEYGSIVHKKGEKAVRYYGGTPGPSILNRGMTCDFEVEGYNGVTFTDKSSDLNDAPESRYNYLYLTDIDGTGNIKVTQREKFGADNYVLNKKETWIAVGEYTQQTYPYTWDFMDWNMKQKLMLGVLDDSNNHGVSYGYWNTTTDDERSLETHEPVAASKVDNSFVWNNVQVDRPLFAQGAQLSYRYVDDINHIDEIRPFKEAEGLRIKQFWGDEIGVGPTYDNEISLDGNWLAFNPTVEGHKLVITIPNIPYVNGEEMWLFIKASAQPNQVNAATNTSAKLVSPDSKESGSDTYNTKDDVWAYKIEDAGDVEILYSKAVNIAAIGVTNIFKSINELGYATESRNHSIDHEYEGVFTKNDVNAYCIQTYNNEGFTYDYHGVPEVRKSTRVHLVPENTGVVLYADTKTSEGKFNVPLFYPACNNTSLSTDQDNPEVKAFRNNWMAPNVKATTHTSEVENWYGEQPCTKFVMTRKYYTYHRSDKSSTENELSPVEAFYRLRIDTNEATAAEHNTIGANKAYLLIPSSKLPTALWNGGTGGYAKNVIFMDLDDFEEEMDGVATEIDIVEVDAQDNETWYTLEGIRLNGRPMAKGIYLRNGKKIYVK